MYITKIKINGFGNRNNQEIQLKPGLNLIMGKNESGKSTVMEFIKAMFYGINKNKAGRNYSDYERLKPWGQEEFSGKLSFIEDKEYTIIREFHKNSGKVYDEEGNDLSKEYPKDRARGIEVGLSHFGIDEETFQNTVFIRQSQIGIESSSQKALVQKLTNLIETGEEEVSYGKTKSKLEKIILEEIGTERTQNKPKNIVRKEIEKNELEKQQLEKNRQRYEELTEKIAQLETESWKADKMEGILKRVIQVKSSYFQNVEDRKDALKIAMQLIQEENQKKQDKKNRKYQQITRICGIVFTVLAAVLVYMQQFIFAGIVAFVAIGMLLVQGIFSRNLKKEVQLGDLTKKEKEIWEEEKEKLEMEKNKIRQAKLGISKEVLSGILDEPLEETTKRWENLQLKQKDKMLELHQYEIERESIKNAVNRLNEIEESLAVSYEEEKKLQRYETCIRLGIEVLERSYEQLKKEVMPDVSKELRENVGKTTNDKYNQVIYNDKQGILIENEQGEYITVDKLSVGTVDQMYLGFRMAILKKLCHAPLILDEIFAYFDDERLESTLITLNEMAKENQIILFACHDREKRMLEKLKMEVNLVYMN